MDGRSEDEWDGKRVTVVKDPKPETIRIVLQKNVNFRCVGAVTGQEYYFPGAGSILEIDYRDVEALLNRPISKSCCGGAPDSPYFVMA